MNEKVKQLETLCPGCTFSIEGEKILIIEYGRRFTVTEESAGLPGKWPECWFDYEIARRINKPVPELEPDEKYQVICPLHRHVIIGYGNYCDQMRKPDIGWYCPICGDNALFDDEAYEKSYAS